MQERIIITGGAGFIGSNFVRVVLAKTNAEIIVFDKLTYAGSLESLRDVEDDPRFRFIRGDIASREEVRALYRDVRPTHVVNFAAESHVDRSIDGPGEFITTNIVGTFELLEGARAFLAEAGEKPREGFRFLHVSTDEVYGSLGSTGYFHETTPYAPNSPYSASKASADHLVRAYFHTYGLPVLLTNCSNNYGPFQFPEKLIPVMILNAIEGKALPIYGDGMNVRDWIYVTDHCEGVLEVLRRGQPGEKYNLGGDSERTNMQVIDGICHLLQKELPAGENPALGDSYQELKHFVTDRPGHDRRYAIDSSKIKQELGWAPRYDFETGLAETVRWYLRNRSWCEAVQGQKERERLGLGEKGESS